MRALRSGGDIAAGQLVVLAYLLPLAAAYVPAGQLADRASAVVVLRLGFVAFLIGAAIVASAPDMAPILAGRVLQGVGAAAMVSGGQAIAFAALGPSRGGRGLGLVHAAVALGMLAGPALGGLLLEHVAWQQLFLIELPMAFAGLALASAHARDTAGPRAVPVSELLRRPSLLRPLGLAIVVFIAMSANMFLMPYLLQRPLALGSTAAGVVLAIVPLAILTGAVRAGEFADRHGSRVATVLGAAFVALGIVGFAAGAFFASVALVVAALIVYGVGAALFQSPNNRAVLAAAPPGNLGLASALLGLSRQLGQATGVFLAGALIGATGGIDRAGYVLAFTVLALVAAAAAVAAVSMPSAGPASTVRVQP